jgi:hypothetical protein
MNCILVTGRCDRKNWSPPFSHLSCCKFLYLDSYFIITERPCRDPTTPRNPLRHLHHSPKQPHSCCQLLIDLHCAVY